MRRILSHIKTYTLRGLLAIIPIGLSLFAIQFFYVNIDKRLVALFNKFLNFSFPGLGILLAILVLYLLGFIASNVIGRKFFHLIEQVTNRIPIVKTIYQVGKQLTETFAVTENLGYQRVVLVEQFRRGVWSIGFVTGTMPDPRNGEEKLLNVFIPNPPLPTTGMLVIIKESETRDPGWTVEEAIKFVISGGIIGPREIK